MGFWSFLRDMFVFDWGVGEYRKRKSSINQTRHSDYNHYNDNNSDCECGHHYDDYLPPRSNRSYGSWDDGHYSSDDYYHDSHDDYAHDLDDFDDDY